MLTRGEQVLPPTYIVPFHLFFGSFLSRRLKVKCILRNYKCVKRIALPSPKQHAFLIPALFSSSLYLSLSVFLLRATHVGTAWIQTQMDLSRPVILSLYISFASS